MALGTGLPIDALTWCLGSEVDGGAGYESHQRSEGQSPPPHCRHALEPSRSDGSGPPHCFTHLCRQPPDGLASHPLTRPAKIFP